MAVSVSGQQVEFREVLLRDKPPSMLELSPKGTVPVLLLNSGEVIDESLDVIDWALNINDPEDWKRSCLLYTSPSPRDGLLSRMPSSA